MQLLKVLLHKVVHLQGVLKAAELGQEFNLINQIRLVSQELVPHRLHRRAHHGPLHPQVQHVIPVVFLDLLV